MLAVVGVAVTSPAEQLREQLAQHRREGRSFFAAWPLAVARIRWESQRGQREWLAAWEDDRVLMAWLLAYDRAPGAPFSLEPDWAETVAFPDAQAQEVAGPQHYRPPARQQSA